MEAILLLLAGFGLANGVVEGLSLELETDFRPDLPATKSLFKNLFEPVSLVSAVLFRLPTLVAFALKGLLLIELYEVILFAVSLEILNNIRKD